MFSNNNLLKLMAKYSRYLKEFSNEDILEIKSGVRMLISHQTYLMDN